MLGITTLKTFDCPKCGIEIVFRIATQRVCHKCGSQLPNIDGLIKLKDDRISYYKGKTC